MDPVILKLLGVLEQLHEEKGVPKQDTLVNKNVIKADNSTFDSDKKEKSGLSGKQKKNLVETFNLFNEMFFDYQKKMRVDEKEKTKVSQLAKKQATPPPLPSQKSEDKGSSLLSMILGGLALLAGSVGTIIASLSGFFGDFGGIAKVIGKVGFMGALKIIGKTILKKFAKSVLKRLPIIGGIIGLTYAVKAFIDGNIFKGVAELISGLLNFIPGVGPLLSLGADVLIGFAESKGMFNEGGALSPENGWKTIKSWMSIIGKTIMDNALYIPIIGTFKRMGMAYDAFSSGNIGEGFKQIGLGLITFFPGGGLLIKGMEVLAGWLNAPKESDGDFKADTSWLGKMKNWIRSKLKDLPWPITRALEWFGIIPEETKDNSGKMAESGAKDGSKGVMNFVGGVWDKMKGPMKDTIDGLGSFASDAWKKTEEYTSKAWDTVAEEAPKIWESIKETSSKAWDTVAEEAPKIWQSIKDTSSKAWDKTKEIGSWFYDSIVSMTDKAKEMINKWIPGIVDTIANVANSAMDVLKNIASKIGGWIAGLFTSDEESKLKNTSTELAQKEQILTQKDDMSLMLVKGSNLQNNWLSMLHNASMEQVKLLGALVNVSSASLSELRRISGSGSSGGTTYISQPQQPKKSQSISIDNNRMGFATSAYALG